MAVAPLFTDLIVLVILWSSPVRFGGFRWCLRRGRQARAGYRGRLRTCPWSRRCRGSSYPLRRSRRYWISWICRRDSPRSTFLSSRSDSRDNSTARSRQDQRRSSNAVSGWSAYSSAGRRSTLPSFECPRSQGAYRRKWHSPWRPACKRYRSTDGSVWLLRTVKYNREWHNVFEPRFLGSFVYLLCFSFDLGLTAMLLRVLISLYFHIWFAFLP